MSNSNTTIFLVDDDALFLKSLEIDFTEKTAYTIRTFATGEEVVKHLHQHPSIIIVDYHLNGINQHAMNGLRTLDNIKGINASIPVILLSSQDSMEVAVNCMRHHAFDYVIKSKNAFMQLQKIITNILYYKKMEIDLGRFTERM